MKVQTFLTGTPQLPSGPRILKTIYKKILHLSEKVPKDAAYRTNLEAIISHRLSVVNEAGGDKTEIEYNICCGSLEMLISQARDEYDLLQKMILWKPWEPLIQRPPPGQWQWPIMNM